MPTAKPRQIFAFSGVLAEGAARDRSFDLTRYAIGLAGVRDRAVRVCYLPTGVGDSPDAVRSKTAQFRERAPEAELSVLTLFTRPSVPDVRAHLMDHDVILVEGGSVVNLLAVWRAHDLAAVLRECWHAGVVLTGSSAGSLCWHQGGPTDSWGDHLAACTDGLGFLPFSNGVHDDLVDQPRRQVYRELVGSGALPPGYATEDGVGLHYLDTVLNEAVSVRPGARAWHVEPAAVGWTERALAARLLMT